jgi:hypothetical protein
MNRPNTRSGTLADIGSAATYTNQYYYETVAGIYYYSNGTEWKTATFDASSSVKNYSGAITTAGTAQLVMPANSARKWLYFQNNGSNNDMFIGIGYTPTTDNGIVVLKVNGSLRFDSFVPTEAIYVICGAVGHKFCCLEGV